MKKDKSQQRNLTLICLVTAIMATAAIFLMEHSRQLQDGRDSQKLQLLRSFSAFSATILSLFLCRPAMWYQIPKFLLVVLCQVPILDAAYQWISYGQILPLEKLLILFIECQVVAMATYTTVASIRRMNLIMAGIIGLIAYSSIQEITPIDNLAAIILLLLTPFWLILEHAIAHPVIFSQSYLEENLIEIDRHRRLKTSGRIIFYLIIAIVVFPYLNRDRSIQAVLGQWVGSSGGNGELNELATSGVGDGPNEVSASENPETTGFTDSEIYLETDRSSLFDAFNEQYGEPFKKQKFERMQAMGAQDVRENGDRPKENLQAGRSFELSRSKTQIKDRQLNDRAADALIYVQGEPEKRLKLSTFDRFDGESWFTEHDCSDHCSLTVEEKQKNKCWFCIHRPVTDLIAGSMNHKIKIANLETSVLPSPNNLWKFLVGGIRQSEMFGWAGLNVIRIKDRNFPAGTTIETVSSRISRRALHELHFHHGSEPTYHHKHFATKISQLNSPRLNQLLKSWDLGEEKSWMQVENLINRLKNHADLTYNSSEIIETNPAAPTRQIDDFLFGSRKGPDYLFASAAVILLRELGYPSRLASGFYIDPKSYSEEKSHYALTSENLHFWVEILLPTNSWAVVDPTPGFTDELHNESFIDHAWIWFYYFQAWFRQNLILIMISITVLMIVILFRRSIYDQAFCLYLARLQHSDIRRFIILTLRHLEWRLAASGQRRPVACSIRRFWLEMQPPLKQIPAMISLAEWAAYAAIEIEPNQPEEEIRLICNSNLKQLNFRYFTKMKLRSNDR
jgi:protein-glutamine gamma-glutamyltransferase